MAEQQTIDWSFFSMARYLLTADPADGSVIPGRAWDGFLERLAEAGLLGNAAFMSFEFFDGATQVGSLLAADLRRATESLAQGAVREGRDDRAQVLRLRLCGHGDPRALARFRDRRGRRRQRPAEVKALKQSVDHHDALRGRPLARVLSVAEAAR